MVSEPGLLVTTQCGPSIL